MWKRIIYPDGFIWFGLEVGKAGSYFHHMKRFFFLIIPLIFSTGIDLRAQDAATEERLNKLSGQIEDLLAAKVEQDKRIAALAKELENVREQAGRPNASY